MLFSIKLKAGLEEGIPNSEDYGGSLQGGEICLIFEAVSRNAVREG